MIDPVPRRIIRMINPVHMNPRAHADLSLAAETNQISNQVPRSPGVLMIQEPVILNSSHALSHEWLIR
jgi:hypothetical protein